jgi:hypothetical protein
MPKIKLATQGDIPRFVHNGLSVISGWTELDTDSLTPESVDALAEYTGRFVRVHEQDADAFRSFMAGHGYEYKDGAVTDTRAEERQRERVAREADAQRVSGTARAPREDAGRGSFQVPPGATEQPAGTSGDVVRERDGSTTDAQKPSNKTPPPRGR